MCCDLKLYSRYPLSLVAGDGMLMPTAFAPHAARGLASRPKIVILMKSFKQLDIRVAFAEACKQRTNQ